MARRVRSCLRKRLATSILLASTVLAWVFLIPSDAEANLLCFFRLARCQGQLGRPSNRQGGGLRTGRARGGDQPHIPYVISPRNTWLETDRFTIRWHPGLGSIRYTVRLWRWSDERDKLDWLVWQTTLEDSQVDYQSQIPLQRGRYYSIEVVADTGVSSCLDQGFDQSGFELIFPEDIAILESDRGQLSQQQLSPEEDALELAALYLREDLIAAAIEVLEPFARDRDMHNPVIYEALGDLYSYAGLNDLSTQYYQKAGAISTVKGDTLGQAIAFHGLAEVNATLGKWAEAIEWFTQAESLYRALDNQALQIASIQRRIKALKLANQAGYEQPDPENYCPTAE